MDSVRAWTQWNGNTWQTVYINTCNKVLFLRVILYYVFTDTEQNVCHFEVHPNETPSTVLVNSRKGCACIRTLCDFIFVDSINITTSNSLNICICNFTDIMVCDFNYSAPIKSYKLLPSISYMDSRFIAYLNWNASYPGEEITRMKWSVSTARTRPKQWTKTSNYHSLWYRRNLWCHVNSEKGWTPLVGHFLDIHQQQ